MFVSILFCGKTDVKMSISGVVVEGGRGDSDDRIRRILRTGDSVLTESMESSVAAIARLFSGGGIPRSRFFFTVANQCRGMGRGNWKWKGIARNGRGRIDCGYALRGSGQGVADADCGR